MTVESMAELAEKSVITHPPSTDTTGNVSHIGGELIIPKGRGVPFKPPTPSGLVMPSGTPIETARGDGPRSPSGSGHGDGNGRGDGEEGPPPEQGGSPEQPTPDEVAKVLWSESRRNETIEALERGELPPIFDLVNTILDVETFKAEERALPKWQQVLRAAYKLFDEEYSRELKVDVIRDDRIARTRRTLKLLQAQVRRRDLQQNLEDYTQAKIQLDFFEPQLEKGTLTETSDADAWRDYKDADQVIKEVDDPADPNDAQARLIRNTHNTQTELNKLILEQEHKEVEEMAARLRERKDETEEPRFDVPDEPSYENLKPLNDVLVDVGLHLSSENLATIGRDGRLTNFSPQSELLTKLGEIYETRSEVRRQIERLLMEADNRGLLLHNTRHLNETYRTLMRQANASQVDMRYGVSSRGISGDSLEELRGMVFKANQFEADHWSDYRGHRLAKLKDVYTLQTLLASGHMINIVRNHILSAGNPSRFADRPYFTGEWNPDSPEYRKWLKGITLYEEPYAGTVHFLVATKEELRMAPGQYLEGMLGEAGRWDVNTMMNARTSAGRAIWQAARLVGMEPDEVTELKLGSEDQTDAAVTAILKRMLNIEGTVQVLKNSGDKDTWERSMVGLWQYDAKTAYGDDIMEGDPRFMRYYQPQGTKGYMLGQVPALKFFQATIREMLIQRLTWVDLAGTTPAAKLNNQKQVGYDMPREKFHSLFYDYQDQARYDDLARKQQLANQGKGEKLTAEEAQFVDTWHDVRRVLAKYTRIGEVREQQDKLKQLQQQVQEAVLTDEEREEFQKDGQLTDEQEDRGRKLMSEVNAFIAAQHQIASTQYPAQDQAAYQPYDVINRINSHEKADLIKRIAQEIAPIKAFINKWKLTEEDRKIFDPEKSRESAEGAVRHLFNLLDKEGQMAKYSGPGISMENGDVVPYNDVISAVVFARRYRRKIAREVLSVEQRARFDHLGNDSEREQFIVDQKIATLNKFQLKVMAGLKEAERDKYRRNTILINLADDYVFNQLRKNGFTAVIAGKRFEDIINSEEVGFIMNEYLAADYNGRSGLFIDAERYEETEHKEDSALARAYRIISPYAEGGKLQRLTGNAEDPKSSKREMPEIQQVRKAIERCRYSRTDATRRVNEWLVDQYYEAYTDGLGIGPAEKNMPVIVWSLPNRPYVDGVLRYFVPFVLQDLDARWQRGLRFLPHIPLFFYSKPDQTGARTLREQSGIVARQSRYIRNMDGGAADFAEVGKYSKELEHAGKLMILCIGGYDERGERVWGFGEKPVHDAASYSKIKLDRPSYENATLAVENTIQRKSRLYEIEREAGQIEEESRGAGAKGAGSGAADNAALTEAYNYWLYYDDYDFTKIPETNVSLRRMRRRMEPGQSYIDAQKTFANYMVEPAKNRAEKGTTKFFTRGETLDEEVHAKTNPTNTPPDREIYADPRWNW